MIIEFIGRIDLRDANPLIDKFPEEQCAVVLRRIIAVGVERGAADDVSGEARRRGQIAIGVVPDEERIGKWPRVDWRFNSLATAVLGILIRIGGQVHGAVDVLLWSQPRKPHRAQSWSRPHRRTRPRERAHQLPGVSRARGGGQAGRRQAKVLVPARGFMTTAMACRSRRHGGSTTISRLLVVPAIHPATYRRTSLPLAALPVLDVSTDMPASRRLASDNDLAPISHRLYGGHH